MTNKARTQESTINTALADVLRGMSPAWTANNVLAESTGVIREHAALKPDILIDADGGQPVVVETEFEPARTVEADAQSRLNKETEYSRRRIEAAVAVKLPRKLRGTSGRSLVTDCEFSYRVLTVDAAGKVPDVPETGAEWFRGRRRGHRRRGRPLPSLRTPDRRRCRRPRAGGDGRCPGHHEAERQRRKRPRPDTGTTLTDRRPAHADGPAWRQR